MIASKILGTAIVALGFSSSALACVTFTGTTSSTMTVKDDVSGSVVQTCKGGTSAGDNNLDCIDGYSLNYDYTDNGDDAMPITYCNNSECSKISLTYTSCDPNAAKPVLCSFDTTFGGDC